MAFADAVVLTPVKLTPGTGVDVATPLATPDGTNGNKFVLSPGMLLRVVNGAGEAVDVTIHTNFQRNGLALPDQTVEVGAGDDVIYQFGDPIDTFWYDKATKQAWIEFESVTSVEVAVYQP